MGATLLLFFCRIQEQNQQGVYGLHLMLAQKYMLAAQGWLQNGLLVILMCWFLKMLLPLVIAFIDLRSFMMSFFYPTLKTYLLLLLVKTEVNV